LSPWPVESAAQSRRSPAAHSSPFTITR
jgi:hypothetical protein